MDIWRTVPGSNGNYEISISTKEGKCRSLNWRAHKGVVHEFANNPAKNNYGRIFWKLTINGKGISQQAARWIAITYPELVQNEYFEGAVIDHIDTDVLNNHPSNLRWVTPKENSNNPITLQHASKGHKGAYPSEQVKEKMRNASPKNKEVIQLMKSGEIVATYRSIREAARKTGLNNGHIWACCHGRQKTCAGFLWKFAN